MFHSATQARHAHPHPLRYMNASGSFTSANALGLRVADNLFHTDVTFPSRSPRHQDRSPHESDCQPSAVIDAMNNQKKGVLDKRDFRKSSDYQYSDDLTFQPEQMARLPHFFANRESAEVAEGSVKQTWCEQRTRLPPSDGTRVSVSYTEDSHHSTDQLEQRTRLPHFHANRSRIDVAEGSNQRGRPTVQYRDLSTAEQTQLAQDRSPHESDGQPSAVPELIPNQKKGVLDKKDLRTCLNYRYSDDSSF